MIEKHMTDVNAELLRRMNRSLTQWAYELVSLLTIGDTFRARTQVEEASEVASLEPFDIEDSTEHLQLSRLSMPLHWALLNGDLLVKSFERRVENPFYILVDCSRSMRFPLRALYAGEPISDSAYGPMLSGKPCLAKMVGGALALAAARKGFLVRIVTCGQDGWDEGVAVPPNGDALSACFHQIDRRFLETTLAPRKERASWAGLLQDYLPRKGVFLVIGDFLDPLYPEDCPPPSGGWERLWLAFRHWAQRRPVLVVRINHDREVEPPPPLGWRGRVLHPYDDRCDLHMETRPGMSCRATREEAADAVVRLRAQQHLAKCLADAFTRPCRGYLALTNSTPRESLRHDLSSLWHRLAGG